MYNNPWLSISVEYRTITCARGGEGSVRGSVRGGHLAPKRTRLNCRFLLPRNADNGYAFLLEGMTSHYVPPVAMDTNAQVANKRPPPSVAMARYRTHLLAYPIRDGDWPNCLLDFNGIGKGATLRQPDNQAHARAHLSKCPEMNGNSVQTLRQRKGRLTNHNMQPNYSHKSERSNDPRKTITPLS